MKLRLYFISILIVTIGIETSHAQSVGINNPSPASSAALDIASTSKGMLIPRMSSSQRTAIASPSIGLLVFDTSNDGFYYYSGMHGWIPLSGTDWSLTGNSGTDDYVNFIGTTDNQDVVFKRGNLEALRIDIGGTLLAKGNGVGGYTPVSGSGHRMMWLPHKKAFRAGKVDNNQWDESNIGDFSFACGYNTVARCSAATAFGIGNYAYATSQFVAGQYNDTIISSSSAYWNGTNPLFVIGNGSSNGNRSNALVIREDGNVGLGVNQPSVKLEVNGQVKISGGNPGTGKVLTSDANGLATWQSSSNDWSLNGNTGTNASTNFIGTADNNDVVLKRNNLSSVRIYSGGAVTATGDSLTGVTPVSGPGTRMMWIPNKAAFRAGYVQGGEWDDQSIGVGSIASGISCIAAGVGSSAMGTGCHAFGNNSLAVGLSAVAAGECSIALGRGSSVIDSNSIAIGRANFEAGRMSVEIGSFNNNLSSDYSLALGNGNENYGDSSISIGNTNEAHGIGSIAFGSRCIAFSKNSIAMGFHTTSLTTSEMVIGQYNQSFGTSVWNGTNPLFVVGNGTSSSFSNAMVVLQNGDLGVGTNTPTAKVDINGSIRVGSGGTEINKVQAGQYNAPSGGNSGVNTYTVYFPNTFSVNPKVVATIKTANNNDVFSVVVKNVSTSQATFKVYRVDNSGLSWGDPVSIDWLAWE